MLTSLFGDLRSLRSLGRGASPPSDTDEPDHGFAATTLLEDVAPEVNERGQIVDNHTRDLEVTGSPAQAIREHFAATRADLDTASRLIALHDPTGLWASGVIKALSDASGRPIERLHLRERSTLRTLATIERTTLERRNEDLLRIYHADVRAPGTENAAIPLALMERSHMTAVIVGAMQPHAVDALIATLQTAVYEPGWRCPTLLFMLPPNAVWIANQIGMTEWPARLKVQVLNESLTSASAVWNALLGMWNRVKKEPVWAPAHAPSAPNLDGFPIRVADLAATHPQHEPNLHPPERPGVAQGVALQALSAVAALDGVLGCAVVDAVSGTVIAQHVRGVLPVPLELTAAASARMLQSNRLLAPQAGLSDDVDEVMTSTSERHHLMRTVPARRDLFLFALLDKQKSQLALVRYKLMQAGQNLG